MQRGDTPVMLTGLERIAVKSSGGAKASVHVAGPPCYQRVDLEEPMSDSKQLSSGM